MTARATTTLWIAQRVSAAALAVAIVVHLGTMIVAVQGGLTAGEILGRTRTHGVWPAFYGLFVVAVAVHAPIGLRNVIAEAMGGHRRAIDVVCLAIAAVLLALGLRAVWAIA